MEKLKDVAAIEGAMGKQRGMMVSMIKGETKYFTDAAIMCPKSSLAARANLKEDLDVHTDSLADQRRK